MHFSVVKHFLIVNSKFNIYNKIEWELYEPINIKKKLLTPTKNQVENLRDGCLLRYVIFCCRKPSKCIYLFI